MWRRKERGRTHKIGERNQETNVHETKIVTFAATRIGDYHLLREEEKKYRRHRLIYDRGNVLIWAKRKWDQGKWVAPEGEKRKGRRTLASFWTPVCPEAGEKTRENPSRGVEEERCK